MVILRNKQLNNLLLDRGANLILEDPEVHADQFDCPRSDRETVIAQAHRDWPFVAGYCRWCSIRSNDSLGHKATKSA